MHKRRAGLCFVSEKMKCVLHWHGVPNIHNKCIHFIPILTHIHTLMLKRALHALQNMGIINSLTATVTESVSLIFFFPWKILFFSQYLRGSLLCNSLWFYTSSLSLSLSQFTHSSTIEIPAFQTLCLSVLYVYRCAVVFDYMCILLYVCVRECVMCVCVGSYPPCHAMQISDSSLRV